MQVPELNRVNSQQRVAETDLPTIKTPVNQPIEAFGGGQEELTRASQQLAGMVGKVAEEQMNRADIAKIEAMHVELIEGKDKIFYDTKDGIFATMKGENSIGSTEVFKERYGKLVEGINKRLNNRQQVLFSGKVKEGEIHGDSLSQKYTAGEMDKWETETILARQIASNNNAIRNVPAGEYEAASQDFLNSDISVERLGKKEGWDDEKIKLKKQINRSNTNLAIIESFVSQNRVSDAKDYMTDIGKDGLVGDDIAKANRLVKAGSLDQESKDKADKLIALHPNDLPKQVEQLEKNKENAELNDLILQRLKLKDDYRERFEREDNENNMKEATLIVVRDGEMPNRALLEKLKLEQVKSLQSYLAMQAKGESPTTNVELKYRLINMATTGQTQEEFRKFPLGDVVNELSKEDMARFVNWQKSIRAGSKENTDGEISQWRQDNDILNKHFKDMGLKTGATPEDEDYKYIQFIRGKVDEKKFIYQNFKQQQKGTRLLDDKEMNAIVGEVVTENLDELDRFSFFGFRATKVLSPEKEVELRGSISEIEEIPDTTDEKGNITRSAKDEIKEITDYLKTQGILNPTEEQIVEQYNKYLKSIINK